MKQKRSAEFKSKVAFEALKENRTLNEIGSEFKVDPLQVGKWKKQLQEEAKEFFTDKRVKKQKDPQEITEEQLQNLIGRLTMENEWLKKKLGL
ncbi:MAG: hypothetical protein NTY13_06370 [Chlamydiae bacterium]|nr:hypothetical protein [Chlamydiota bacterium]